MSRKSWRFSGGCICSLFLRPLFVGADLEAWLGCGARETVALVERLHQFDVMRANKAPFAWGLEPRVPFLDKAFLDVSMAIDPAEKMVRARGRRP